MRALVTGATGFIGANVARELLAEGFSIKALVRPTSDLRNICGLDLDVVVGDLCDMASLDRAMEGCDALFHVAASYSFWTPAPRQVYETNVKGTENILSVAATRGLQKIVYTSTESTVGIPPRCEVGMEDSEVDPATLTGHYKKSKLLAERIVLSMSGDGVPVVVVNPTTPVGPYDVKPTPTGQMIVAFLNGKMPAYVNTGLNIVDVQDVARGHVLAFEKGKVGHRYILGNKNLAYREILGILEQTTGLRAPRMRIPIWLALGTGYVDEFLCGKVLRRRPRIPVAAVKTAKKFRYFDCSRAVEELGMPQTPVELAFEKAVKWFAENGYVGRNRLNEIQKNMAGRSASARAA